MDVSLSHTGGIIAVIDENHLKDLDSIASKVDLLNEDLMSQEAVEQIKKQK